MKRSAIVIACLVAVIPAHASDAASQKKSAKKRVTTTKAKPKARFVWMCDLVTRIDMNLIPDHVLTSVINPFQKGGDRSDWRTEDLARAADSSSGTCQVFYSGEAPYSHSVTVTQAYKKTEEFFIGAPDWNPTFKWTKVRVDGIDADTWSRRNGRYRAKNNIEMAPSCYVGVRTERGVFSTQVQYNASAATDATQVDCGIAEESMRRTLAGLEAGGYKYLK